MKPNLGIDDKDRVALVKLLNGTLADLVVLFTKTRNYHWNVRGEDFLEFHELFGKQYDELNDAADEVAERARQLGGDSLGTLEEFRKASRLEEKPGDVPDGEAMVKNLVDDHETVIRALRESIDAAQEKHGDAGTADLLTGLIQQHEKMAWFLRSYLEK